MRNNYKESWTQEAMNNRGQVALFVILAIVIVGVVIFFFVYPKVSVLVTNVEPSSFLKDCLEPEVNTALQQISSQGGYLTPTNSLMYKGDKIQYLCYTSEDYKPCIIQQPLLVRHVEQELKNFLEPKARDCLSNLQQAYEKRGYSVTTSPGDINISIVPGNILVDFDSQLTVSKDSSQTFRKISLDVPSQLYDLLTISTSILQVESTLGNSETTLYIQYYPDLKIEKLSLDNGTIYKITNVVTKDYFRFATRSLVWPQGYTGGQQ